MKCKIVLGFPALLFLVLDTGVSRAQRKQATKAPYTGETTPLSVFKVPRRPMDPKAATVSCKTEGYWAVESKVSSDDVDVLKVDDGMDWQGKFSAKTLTITTSSGFTLTYDVVERSASTLRAVSRVSNENITVDYRTGRALFVSVVNLAPSLDPKSTLIPKLRVRVNVLSCR